MSKILIQTLSEQAQAGMTRGHLPVSHGSHSESSTSPRPRVPKFPSCPFASNLDRERDDEEKTEEEKTKKKNITLLFLFLRSPARFPARNSPPNLSICSAQSNDP